MTQRCPKSIEIYNLEMVLETVWELQAPLGSPNGAWEAQIIALALPLSIKAWFWYAKRTSNGTSRSFRVTNNIDLVWQTYTEFELSLSS